MKKFSVVLVFSLLSIFASQLSRAEDLSENEDCLKATLQHEMNACAEVRFIAVDKELNRTYKELLSKLSGSSKSLRDAQRAWIVFRDKTCDFEASGVEGGSMWGLEYYNCMAGQTRKRISELERYIECTQNGCPY